MKLKIGLKQLCLGLLIVSANGAAISNTNCKEFRSASPEIEFRQCIENQNGEIISL